MAFCVEKFFRGGGAFFFEWGTSMKTKKIILASFKPIVGGGVMVPTKVQVYANEEFIDSSKTSSTDPTSGLGVSVVYCRKENENNVLNLHILVKMDRLHGKGLFSKSSTR
eukprot:Platyproteum_vivax@DN11755_c0_g1_i1.p1